MRGFFKVTGILLVNLCLLIGLYLGAAAIFHQLNDGKSWFEQAKVQRFDKNLVRATYPNYQKFEPATALAIFEEYYQPTTAYRPFVGYRRNGFKGSVVNILEDSGFRISTNHAIDNSVWFFGGSSMWGTGATDSTTIPSLYASKTGEQVLNLGESGYNSLQELAQLNIMLARGLRPAKVVFYDGFNDSYYHCQRNIPIPSHAFDLQFRDIVQNHALQALEGEDVRKQVTRSLKPSEFLSTYLKTNYASEVDFLLAPLIYATKSETPEQDIQAGPTVSDKPISQFNRSQTYHHCDETQQAEKAANVLVSSWLAVHSILKDRNIPVHFVLQPAATYHPEKYNLNYLTDYDKQRIVDEADSYKGFTKAVMDAWQERCVAQSACDALVDMSKLFFDDSTPVFIDSVHLSPNGNQKVVDALLAAISEG
ncbi:MAG: SGNH/GDSL hydrolase family protein [Pseudomonadota bacterium]